VGKITEVSKNRLERTRKKEGIHQETDMRKRVRQGGAGGEKRCDKNKRRRKKGDTGGYGGTFKKNKKGQQIVSAGGQTKSTIVRGKMVKGSNKLCHHSDREIGL